MYNEQELINAVAQSFEKYVLHGARSTEKLKPLHHFFAQSLQKIFGEEFAVHYLGENTKERKVAGLYYPKDIDISVTKKQGHDIGHETDVFCLGIKFVTSNFSQNANNYFESMLGETANIQSNAIPYAQIIILRHHTPYYNEKGELKSIETLDIEKLRKYTRLAESSDNTYPHKPFHTTVILIDICKENAKDEKDKYFFEIAKPSKPNTICPKFEVIMADKVDEALRNDLSFKELLNKISEYKKTI